MNRNDGYALESKMNMTDSGNNVIITPEMRAYYMPFSDPLTLNFRVLLDFSCSEGLIADENNTNSALAYLKRIGDTVRYDALKNWITNLKDLFKNYDFLITNIDGIDDAVCCKLSDKHINGNFSITIRETLDMRVQSIINAYQQIYYDFQRDVQVIPKNLRRIPMCVLIYSAGYYNSSYYDLWQDIENIEYEKILSMNPTISREQFTADSASSKNEIARSILPTYRKLNKINQYSDLKSTNTNSIDVAGSFSYELIYFPAAYISDELSGKTFFSSLSNEPSGDMVKNVLSFDYHAIFHSGMFPNMFGAVNLANILSMMSAQNQAGNVFNETTGINAEDVFDKTYWQQWLDKSTSNTNSVWLKNFNSSWKNLGSTLLDNSITNFRGKYNNMIKSFADNVSKSIVSITAPNFLSDLVSNTGVKLISKVEQEFYSRAGIEDINKLITMNFTQSALNAYYNVENEVLNTITTKLFPEVDNDVNIAAGNASQDGSLLNSPRLASKEVQTVNEYYKAETIDPNLEKGIRLFSDEYNVASRKIKTERKGVSIYNRKSL